MPDENLILARDIANTLASVFSREIFDIMKVDSTSVLDEAVLPATALVQNKVTEIADCLDFRNDGQFRISLLIQVFRLFN